MILLTKQTIKMLSWFNWIKPLVDLVSNFMLARLSKKANQADDMGRILDDVALAQQVERRNAERSRSAHRSRMRQQWKRDYE